MGYRRTLAVLLGLILTACHVEVAVYSPPAMATQVFSPTPEEIYASTPTETSSSAPTELDAVVSACPPDMAPETANDGSYIGMINPWSDARYDLIQFYSVGSYQERELVVVYYPDGPKHVILLEALICEDEGGLLYWEVIDEIILSYLAYDESIYVNCYHDEIWDSRYVGIGPIPDGSYDEYPLKQAWVVIPEEGRFEKVPVQDIEDLYCYQNY